MKSYQVYRCSIQLRDRTIFGILIKPLKKLNCPAAIICHGFAGSYQDNLNYALDLAENGIASFSFDFCGGSLMSRSSKKTTEMSVMTELQDLKDTLKALKTVPFIDDKHIYLLGESQGGLVCALAAAQLKKDIKALILLYPAFNIPDNARSEYRYKVAIPVQFGLWGTPLGRCYYQDIYDLHVFQTINQYTGPVMIFHGDKDELVNISYSIQAKQCYHHAKVNIIENVGHGFYGQTSQKVSKMIVEFIKDLTKA